MRLSPRALLLLALASVSCVLPALAPRAAADCVLTRDEVYSATDDGSITITKQTTATTVDIVVENKTACALPVSSSAFPLDIALNRTFIVNSGQTVLPGTTSTFSFPAQLCSYQLGVYYGPRAPDNMQQWAGEAVYFQENSLYGELLGSICSAPGSASSSSARPPVQFNPPAPISSSSSSVAPYQFPVMPMPMPLPPYSSMSSSSSSSVTVLHTIPIHRFTSTSSSSSSSSSAFSSFSFPSSSSSVSSFSSLSSSAASLSGALGCIDVTKQAQDLNGAALQTIPQFIFVLDGGAFVLSDDHGHARFSNVAPGPHTIAEPVPWGWQLLSVTPPEGKVTVTAGSACANVSFSNRKVPTSSASSH